MWFRVLLLVAAVATRFGGLKWGGGFFFHPDENNMAWAIEKMHFPDLNPHFFAYGQLPPFLVYFTGWIIWGSRRLPFALSIYLLRFYSAFFALATIILGWWLVILGRKWWPKLANRPWLYPLLLVFTPGLIQMAHFGTTEAWLTFWFLLLVCLTIWGKQQWNGWSRRHRWSFVFWLAGVAGASLATKISAAVFLFPLVLSWLLFGFLPLSYLIGWSMTTFLFFLLFSPYNFLAWPEFWWSMRYETAVARGTTLVFYTRQFINTLPIVFQITRILPWVLGVPSFLILVVSFFQIRKIYQAIRKNPQLWFLVTPPLFWFLFHSFLFAKWTRFITPILPFLVLVIALFLNQLANKRVVFSSLLVLALMPGIFFCRIYFTQDIRLRASRWLNQRLPIGAVVLAESGNVVDLPVVKQKNFHVINFDFYSLDETPQKWQELSLLLNRADFILLPSRRVFANHLRLPHYFPKTAWFYQQLFAGKLGFTLWRVFSPLFWWERYFLGEDTWAEETWTVFDHPTIRLYKRVSLPKTAGSF